MSLTNASPAMQRDTRPFQEARSRVRRGGTDAVRLPLARQVQADRRESRPMVEPVRRSAAEATRDRRAEPIPRGARRASEIGVRLALGATPARVLRTVVCDSVRMVCVGTAVGTPIGWIAARGATIVMGGARVDTAASLVIGGVLLAVAAIAATAPPAIRASAVDPIDALRQD